MSSISADEYMQLVTQNIGTLRNELKAGAPKIIDDLLSPQLNFTGDAYVETVGTVVYLHKGVSEYFYTPTALHMRDTTLELLVIARKDLYDAIAKQFPAHSRILNIGAGGDIVPIKSMQDANHTIISTDLAEDTIKSLKARINTPAFACDLVYLPRILPEPVDYIIGNSTLGYIEPAKLNIVVKNVYDSMSAGGIFTFDLAPHPHYFCIARSIHEQTVANESAADPEKLLEFIEEYGIENGINAMAYFTFYQAISVKLAMLFVLKRLFERIGARCSSGVTYYGNSKGDRRTCLILRVAKSADEILVPVHEEQKIESALDESLEALVNGSPAYELAFIDRGNGELLAQKLGIHKDRRSDPWLVAEYIREHQNSKILPNSIKNEVLAKISPANFADQIWPYADSQKKFLLPTPLPAAVAADQILHKLVIVGEAPFGRDAADARIDLEYSKIENRQKRKDQRLETDRAHKKKRDDRKNKKAARKKQRK